MQPEFGVVRHLIAGSLVPGEGRAIAKANPANGERVSEFAEATEAQVELAVAAAKESFEKGAWSEAGHGEKREFLRRAADGLIGNAEELAAVQIAESGLVRTDVERQIRSAAAWFEYYREFLTFESGETYRRIPGATAIVDWEPVGVCALFTPWNAPVSLAALKLAPALAAGNSVVLKPSEETPATAARLVEILQDAGVPDGVLNCVNGRGVTTGAALANSAGVDMASFTGGHAGGRAVAEAAARRHAPCILELGGKSATLVFEDADLDAALDGAAAAAFGANGEACLAGSRILVQDTVAERFFAGFKEKSEGIAVGDPCDRSVRMGPMISSAHKARVLGFYESAEADGDEILCGGDFESIGQFVRPGAVKALSTGSRIWKEEVFGPVAALMAFSDEEDAVRLANGTEYGLAGYVWTRDASRALRVSKRMRAGTVVVNSAFLREQNAPFGGFKQSGIGREGGEWSWRNFTEAKTTVIKHG